MVRALSPLEKCFADGKLETVLPSVEKSQRSISQARYMLIEAKNAAESDSPVLALSGIYFAMFHAARAVLYGDGIREKSHFCVEKYLESYVSSGTLERKWIALFGRMRERREKNQYDLATPATPEEIRALLILAEKFVDELEMILEGRNP